MVKKSYTLIWDKIALQDFKVILNYLSTKSNQAPKIVKAAVSSRLDVIKSNPKISELDKLKDKANEDFRAFVVFSYRVTYRIKQSKKEILIIRIRHTSMEPLGY